MTTDIIFAYTLRTISVTENQWISIAATTMEDDSIPSVEMARSANLKSLHASLAAPPPMELGVPTTWREPHDDMKVTVTDTIVRHDLVTGEIHEERELESYTIKYAAMNTEEN